MSKIVGYKKLTKLDFLLSDIRMFGIGLKGWVKLSMRPLHRLFFIGYVDQAYFDVAIVSSRREGIRGAVEVFARYYSLFGKALKGADRKYQLFADPELQVSSQRLWFTRPQGAVFVSVQIKRLKKGADIGMSGALKLKRGAIDETEVALAEILRCRDEMLLLSAYTKAEEDCHPEHAKRILERMIFIWQKPETFRALAYIDDTRQLVAKDFQFDGRFAPVTGTEIYDYTELFSDVENDQMPFSKRMAFECRMLEATMQGQNAGLIRIPEGPNAFARLVAAKGTKADIICDATDFTDLPPWIERAEADAFIQSCRLDA